MRSLIVVLLVSFSIFHCPKAHSRVLTLPALARRATMSWASLPPSTPVGFTIYYMINLTEVMGTAVSGTLTYNAGTVGYGNGSPVTPTYFLCSNIAGKSVSTQSNPVGTNTSFTVAAKSTTMLEAVLYLSGTYNSGIFSVDGNFTPVLQISINGDAGAVVGSVASYVTGGLPSPACDGSTFNATAVPTFIGTPSIDTFYPILGGHAF